jgi:Osmosensitive K+ channel histidine kinase
MPMNEERSNRDNRPSPDALLQEAAKESRGRLKIFLGAAPGVGKTYEMLTTAQAKRREGVDVVVGVAETHGRKETEALLDGLEVISRRLIEYKGHHLREMDIDAILTRRPKLALGRRARPYQRAGLPPSQALSRCRGAARRRHRRLCHAEHPACREPQRRRRQDHRRAGPRDGAGFDHRPRR